MNDETAGLLQKWEEHSRKWVNIPLAVDSTDDLEQLDTDMNSWFGALEDIMEKLKREIRDGA